MSKIHIFVSFDLDHDGDLCDLLLEQSGISSYGFDVSGRSKARSVDDLASDGVRRQIREADEVIVICGEHTEDSMGVSAELRIAQEERTPYFLLWGRREIMCTKPLFAKRDEGIYSWTSEILQSQILLTLRNARWDSKAGGTPATPEA
ncbi:MAG: hypothetical protein OEM05_13075 [Myxococcales bacterium]|nr:hypothetical protein [Myxococcales bacterium]